MEEESNNQPISWFSKIKKMAKKLKKEVGALYLASKRSDVPFHAKAVAILVVGYALSPIDLIPDFIPVVGYIDDLILVPLGISFAIKLIPKDIMDECRIQAEDIFRKGRPKNLFAGGIIIFIWLVLIIYIFKKLI
ncbi:YkvA family protein [Clostridium chromiireducens]|uniref:YkvA family protein n=1 Tax=Clostridium chromiireducens TaxID=225345 RepID=UPI003AF442B9